ADLSLAGEFVSRGAFGGLVFENNRKALAKALEDRNKTVSDANKRYVDLWNFDATKISKAIQAARNKEVGALGKDARPTLNFLGSGAKDKDTDKVSEAQRLLEQLTKQREALEGYTVLQQISLDLDRLRLKAN